MSNLKGFSKEQKQTADLVQKEVGDDVIMEISKTKKNHIKYVIEGCEKPIYTGGTPSCNRAQNKHLSTVRRLVARKKFIPDPIDNTECSTLNSVKSETDNVLVLINGYRQRIEQELEKIKLEEKQNFQEFKSPEKIKQYREAKIAIIVKEALNESNLARKYQGNKLRRLQKDANEFLNDKLPTLAFYKDELKANKNISATNTVLPAKANKIHAKKKSVKAEKNMTMPKIPQAQSVDLANLSYQELKMLSNQLNDLMAMKQTQALADIMAIAKANALNHEDILEAMAG